VGGTYVTIYGTSLTSALQVTIGGVSCSSVSLVSDTILVCLTGAHVAGAVDVVVTNSEDVGVTLASSFTYSNPVITSVLSSYGPTVGGTYVDIIGDYFSSSPTATLAGISCATVEFISSKKIRCTSGPSPLATVIAGPVIVTNSDGQIASRAGVNFSYQVPRVDSFSPTSGPQAGGSTITIRGINFGTDSGTTVSIGGFSCGNVSVVSSTTLTCTTAVGVVGTSYTVIVTNSDGSVSAASTNSFSYTSTPPSFTYPVSGYFYPLDTVTTISSITPTIVPAGALDSFSISPTLPTGLSISPSTGVISGKASTVSPMTTYTISAVNLACSTSTACQKNTSFKLGVFDFGTGSSNSTISSDTVVSVDDYAYVTTSSLAVGTKVFSIDSVGNFVAGDLILIAQMQTSTTPSTAKTWEFARITSLNSTTVTLSSDLKKSYLSGTRNSASAKVTQIVKVREYDDFSVDSGFSYSPPAWDPTLGKYGILALRAQGTATVSGTISANAVGFTGGAGTELLSQTTGSAIGYAGESWYGLGTQSYAANRGGGGGGSGSVSVSGAVDYAGAGGAGGSFGSWGVLGPRATSGLGTTSANSPGTPYGSSTGNFSFLLGSGGGGPAYISDDVTSCNLGTGGAGGGGVFILANLISIPASGLVSAQGGSGTVDTCNFAAISGAGSGGVVYLIANEITVNALTQVRATGGSPVSTMSYTGASGGAGLTRMDCGFIQIGAGTKSLCSSTLPTYFSNL
jgi:hypothetical protein